LIQPETGLDRWGKPTIFEVEEEEKEEDKE
jgi:hypothetical protein